MHDHDSSPVQVDLREDGMAVSLRAKSGFTPGQITDELCVTALRRKEVQIDEAAAARIVEFVHKCSASPGEAHVQLIAEGKPARHGRDGRLFIDPEFTDAGRSASEEDAESGNDPDGADQTAVDHYNRSTLRVVEPGRIIGRVIPPTRGESGVTVTGREVRGRDGEPYTLPTDDSIAVREDGAIVAILAGALQIMGDRLRVMPSLEIPGWVDFSTGNIAFPANVTIQKGVRDCFLVDASGDIVVHGPVEAATLRAGRDVRLLGGMAGREKGSLFAQRDLHARYLGMVAAVVGRDMFVEKECVDSDIEVRGSVQSENCIFIGGRLASTAACTLAEIGGESGVPTEIILGKSPAADRQIGRAGGLRSEIERRLEPMVQERNVLRAGAQRLSREQRNRLAFLEREIGLFESMRQELTGVSDRLRDLISGVAVAALTVRRTIHAGVTLVLGAYEVQMRSPLHGPVCITLNAMNRPIAMDPATKSPRDLVQVATIRALRTGGSNASKAA